MTKVKKVKRHSNMDHTSAAQAQFLDGLRERARKAASKGRRGRPIGRGGQRK